MAGAASLIKILALTILLISLTMSLHGCGCDTEAASKCGSEAMQKMATAADSCAALKTAMDCGKDCCDSKVFRAGAEQIT